MKNSLACCTIAVVNLSRENEVPAISIKEAATSVRFVKYEIIAASRASSVSESSTAFSLREPKRRACCQDQCRV